MANVRRRSGRGADRDRDHGGIASTTTPATHVSGKLVLDNESGATWTCQFNAFNPAVNGTSVGFVYETLNSSTSSRRAR